MVGIGLGIQHNTIKHPQVDRFPIQILGSFVEVVSGRVSQQQPRYLFHQPLRKRSSNVTLTRTTEAQRRLGLSSLRGWLRLVVALALSRRCLAVWPGARVGGLAADTAFIVPL